MKHTHKLSVFVKWAIVLAIPAAISTQLSGCDDSSGPPDYALPNRYFKDSVQPIFESHNCTGCHQVGGSGWGNTGGDSGGLDLTNAYANLVNQPSYERREVDTIARLRVKPGFPDSSYLYHKLTRAEPGAGSRMPLGGDALPDSEIAVIKKWIQYGAPLGDTTTHSM